MADPRHYEIAVIGGDGTGPEVVEEGKKVLEAAGKKFGINFSFTKVYQETQTTFSWEFFGLPLRTTNTPTCEVTLNIFAPRTGLEPI